MNIPKRFHLHGQKIEVEFDSSIDFKNDNRGEAQFRSNRIAIAPSTEQTPRPVSHVEQTFCHELMHYLAYHAGIELNERETDLMGNLLHQALTSAEYCD